MTKVFIDGNQGTTGLKIFNRIKSRKDIELLTIEESKRKDSKARKEMINESDITFLCLPDVAAKTAVSLTDNKNTKIIDTSTAHRTSVLWDYGFPELSDKFRKNIENSSRVAVPGCHASGFNAIVYPLVNCGILPEDYPIVCHSITGYSGGGKKMIKEYESDSRNDELCSPRQYALTQQHKHLNEVMFINSLKRTPIFSPIVADFPQGMVVTIPIFLDMMTKKCNLNDIHNIFSEHYQNSPFIKVRELGYSEKMIGANNFENRDDMEIEINGNEKRAVITARFDNLGKGASGAAMQCMNIMLGKDETTGLILGD